MISSIDQAAHNILTTSNAATQVSSDMAEVAWRQRKAVDMMSTEFHETVATANEIVRTCSQAAESAAD